MSSLITTTKGLMDPADLEKREGRDENANEICNWVEYWDGDELVHRSVALHLKTGVFGDGIQASF